MQFDPVVHTKDFLMSNKAVAFLLAEKSSSFVKSALSDELELLSLRNESASETNPPAQEINIKTGLY
jgi:hypothetical protein